MKVLTIDEARTRLDSVCEEVLAGEVIRLRRANGALIELTPVTRTPLLSPLSAEQLAESYDGEEWATFENHCAKSSD